VIVQFPRADDFVDADGRLTLRAATFLEEVVNVQDWQEIGVGNNPAFENSWVNYGTTFDTAAYYKDALGIVHVKGLVKSGTATAAIFTLPTGYRPASTLLFVCVDGTNLANRVDVDADGTINAAASASNSFQSLNFSFRAA